MAAPNDVLETFRFGKFVLEPQRRSLTASGKKVDLSARAFDILRLLIEHRDRIVTKDELRAEVWRGMTVDDNNLAVQISLLRRALGEKTGGPQYILTVPGKGYQFVAPLEDAVAPPPREAASPGPTPPQAEPAAVPMRHARLRIALPIAAGLFVLVASAWFGTHHAPKPAAPRLSIAVLPFRNLGPDTEQNYLADAINDDLTTDLSHIPESVVIARTSADTYRGRAVPAADIGQALNVRYLLEGSLRAEGPQLHINAQLIDAATGTHLWARAFDVPRDKLGVTRADIVRSITSALNVTLVDIEGERSLHERPRNPDAEDLYLRARSVISRGNTLASFTQAQALLEKALAVQPEFADALAFLAYVLVHKLADFDDPAEDPDLVKAQQIIARAVSVAPRDAVAVGAKAYLTLAVGKPAEAEAGFQLALQLDPGDLSARSGLASCAKNLGHMAEMIAQNQELLRIDPANPANPRRQQNIGYGYLMLGQPGEAVTWLNRAGAALGDAALGEKTLGWQEWRLIELIAATELAGDHPGAISLYANYSKVRPYRTVWRLAAYDTSLMVHLPGDAAYRAALHRAGMPNSLPETQDFGVPPAARPQERDDFDPTPLTVPGATRIVTADLVARLKGGARPLILDLGRGVGVIPGAVWLWSLGDESQEVLLRRAIARAKATPESPIVVMGDSPLGWTSYNAVLQLVAQGYHSVLWYRGGEEAWNSAACRRIPAVALARLGSPTKVLIRKWEGAMSGKIDPDGPRISMGNRVASTVTHPIENPAVLALDGVLFENLPPHQLDLIKVIQLEYARDISTRAATAYQAIIDALTK